MKNIEAKAESVKTVSSRINTPTPTLIDAPATLQRGDVIYRETLDLGLGYDADITVVYAGAAQTAPEDGAVWPDEYDHPAVEMTIILLRGAAIRGATVLGEACGTGWGVSMTDNRGYKTAHVVRPQLSAALDAALQLAAKDLGSVKIVLAKRAARLDRRAKTTQAGIDIAAI